MRNPVVEAVTPAGVKVRVSYKAFKRLYEDKGWKLHGDHVEDDSDQFIDEEPAYVTQMQQGIEPKPQHGEVEHTDEVSSDYKVFPGGLNG